MIASPAVKDCICFYRLVVRLRKVPRSHWARLMASLAACFFAAIGVARAGSEGMWGNSRFGRSNYVEYLPGTLPVIISVPHGGALTPAEIPNRVRKPTSKQFTIATDTKTYELALSIQGEFKKRLGGVPHIVICHLKRTKVDCNRDLEEGTGGNPLAAQAWREFHEFINTASNRVVTAHSHGFYIDLHGHGNPIKRLELGYLLKGFQLTNSDAVLIKENYAALSSVRALAARTPNSFAELLRGPRSLGALLADRGIPAVPSPAMPSPGNGVTNTVYPGDRNAYFSGGYNTRVHTSADSGGPIDGVQIETHWQGVRDTPACRTRFGMALADVMNIYFREHYGRPLKRPVRLLQSPRQKGA